jgi:ubiquitin
MTFLKKLLGRAPEPKTRVRVCIECGKPVEQHADWCAILRTQQEMDRKSRGLDPTT